MHTSRSSPEAQSAVASWLIAIGYSVTPFDDPAEASLPPK